MPPQTGAEKTASWGGACPAPDSFQNYPCPGGSLRAMIIISISSPFY